MSSGRSVRLSVRGKSLENFIVSLNQRDIKLRYYYSAGLLSGTVSMGTSALVIDDDELFQNVAQASLEALGFESVYAANDGVEGLAAVLAAPEAFGLILCDLQMPNMDGAKAIRELGQMGYKGQLVIISSLDAALRESVFQMGTLANVNVKGTLAKPLILDDLKQLVDCDQLVSSNNVETIEREDLLNALETRQLRPFYQPKINLSTNRVEGFEVLCRHVGNDGTVSAPAPYIQSAMTYSLIGTLTQSMIEQVTQEASSWTSHLGEFNLAINMSPACIQNPNLPDRISRKFKSAGFDPSMITLEITEDRLLENQAVIQEVLSRLRLAGFKLSLDDFGTGAAGVQQLRRFPFHEVKIDRQFVQNSVTDEFSKLVVETAVKLSNLCGMSVVAEGVETEDMLRFVRQLGATTAQGFFYSPALAPEHVLDWVSQHNRNWSIAV